MQMLPSVLFAKTVLLVAVMMPIGVDGTLTKVSSLLEADFHRRLSTVDFVGVVACTTWGLLPDFPGPDALVFADYGCWCGTFVNRVLKGPCNGGKVVDATDACCKTHDGDWAAAPPGCVCSKQDYDWECNNLSIFPLRFQAACDPVQPNACATYCCDVDVKFSNCLKAAAATQNNAFIDFSDPGAVGCKPCFDETAVTPSPSLSPPEEPPTLGCDDQPCCNDCVCCGPGTMWTGESCVLSNTAGAVEDPCSEYDGEPKCLIPKCREQECCGPGTAIVAHPLRESRCFCYPEFTPPPTQQ